MKRRAKIRLCLAFLGVMHAAILAAGFLAPYPYDEQHRDHPYSPPGNQGDRTGPCFLLGSDGYGRDIFSRVLYGGRISLLTGVLATAVSLALGMLLGGVAGYFGGWIDTLVMRSSELLLALPWLYLLLGVRASLPLHIEPLHAFLLLITIIGTVGWVRPARIIRGVVLSAKERGFVLAARGFGASHQYLLRRHIMPLTFRTAATQATILIPQYITAEVTLSFLGLGVGEPVPSWGNMLADARQFHSLIQHPWLLAPALFLAPVLFGYICLADALTDHKGG